MRLALVSGLAEMLTVAAIRDLTPEKGPVALCIYGRPISMPEALRRECLDHAHLFGPWANVIDGVANEITAALSGSKPATIMTHMLGGPIESQVLDLFPDSEIEFFDNGLASHIDLPVVERPVVDKKAIPAAALGRVSTVWLSLLDDLQAPRHFANQTVRGIPGGTLRAVSKVALERMPQAARPSPGAPVRMILGTAFYRMKVLDHAEERRIYLKLVRAWRQQSDAPIVYKEHPRARMRPLLGERDGVQVIESRLPLELWAEARPISQAASISSSGLLTLRRFYGSDVCLIGTHVEFPRDMAHISLIRSVIEPCPGSRPRPAR